MIVPRLETSLDHKIGSMFLGFSIMLSVNVSENWKVRPQSCKECCRGYEEVALPGYANIRILHGVLEQE